MSLEVAINSQDYTSDAVPFFYYAPPSVTSVSPASGIFYGGTTVTVAGTGLLHAAAPAAEAGGGDYSSSVWAPSWLYALGCSGAEEDEGFDEEEGAFEEAFLRDYNDALATAFLATATKNAAAVNDLSDKFVLVNARGSKLV